MKKVLLVAVVSLGLLAGSVSSVNATSDWGDAIAIPALIGLNTGSGAQGNSVSCASAGNCAVTGYYQSSAGDQGFVVNQTNGTWGDAIAIPALSVLNTGDDAQGTSVSCASAGNCAVTGSYEDSAGTQGFVVNQTSGTWGNAIAIPALIGLNTSGDAVELDLNDVDAAMARLEKGTYFIDEITGAPIQTDFLASNPLARRNK